MTTFPVKGGFWETFSNSVLTLTTNASPLRKRVSRSLDREMLKGFRQVMIALDGVAPGGTATKTHKRVLAREDTSGDLSGKRTIETVTDVNRVTTAADVTNINANWLANVEKPASYPANGDGNPRNVPGG